MANALYPLWKQALERGDPNSDLDNNTAVDGVYCALVNTNIYTYSPAHQFYSSLSGIIATDQRIATPVVAPDATFYGEDVFFPTVVNSGGQLVAALVLYRRNSGAPGTWRLVYYYDTPGNGLPLVPNGGNITVQWNSEGIFRL
jgi:hypothetical protein